MHTKSQDSSSDAQRNLTPFRAGWSLMSRKEKHASAWIALGIVLIGLVDAAALMSVLPVIHLITEPNILEKPGFLQTLYEHLGKPQVNILFPYLAGISLLLLMISTVLRQWSDYVAQQFSSRCQTRLGGELLAGVLNADYDWALRQSPIKLTRLVLNDVALWANSFVRRLGVIANAAVTGFVAIGLVLIYSPWQISAVISSTAFLAFLALHVSKNTIARMSVIHRNSAERISTISHQAISGLKDVKMTNKESAIVALLVEALTLYGNAMAVNNSLRLIPSNLIMFLGQASIISVALMLWWVGTSSGEIASQVALLAMASSRMIPAMNRLSIGAGVLLDSLPYLQGILALKEEVDSAKRTQGNVKVCNNQSNWDSLVFKDVCYFYPNAAQPSISKLNLVLQSGRSYGVVGPSGSGKSTFVDLLAGLLVPTSGGITVDGEPLESKNTAAWRAGIGYVSQAPFLLDDTLRANVAFGLGRGEVDDALVWDCLRKAHLEDVTLNLEKGLDTHLGDRGLRLSGGQRQRIAIARALYRNPMILVLDEATSALDGISEAAIQTALNELHGQITIITVAHRLTTILNVDSIVIFDHGSLLAMGTYQTLLETSPLFRTLALGSTTKV